MTKAYLPTVVTRICSTEYRLPSPHLNLAQNYVPPDAIIRQAMINILQKIQLLKNNNSGIYQYDFINELLHAIYPQRPQNVPDMLDELIFEIVYESKEDDGLEGAATIRENSPAVQVTPDGGGKPWVIPELLDENLLDYDIAFMANRFTQTLIQYCLRQNLRIQEVRQDFITQYGITPIVSYIQAKYADNAPNDLQQRVETAIKTSAQQIASSSASTPSQIPQKTLPPPSMVIQVSESLPAASASTPSPALALPPLAFTPFASTPSQESWSTALGQIYSETSARPAAQPVSAITPSVVSIPLNLSDPSSAAKDPSSAAKYARRIKKGINSNEALKGRVEFTTRLRTAKRNERVAAIRSTPSLSRAPSLIASQGGHTKKKHHKRKKRETQKKRSKSTSQ
jgi:hypothetical protein